MKRRPTLQYLFHRFADTSVYGSNGTGSVKVWKTRHKISGYFYSVRAYMSAGAAVITARGLDG